MSILSPSIFTITDFPPTNTPHYAFSLKVSNGWRAVSQPGKEGQMAFEGLRNYLENFRPVSCFYLRKVWTFTVPSIKQITVWLCSVGIYLLFSLRKDSTVHSSPISDRHIYLGSLQVVLLPWVASRAATLSSAATSRQSLCGALVLCARGALVPREGTHTFWMSDNIFLRARQLSRSVKSLFP